MVLAVREGADRALPSYVLPGGLRRQIAVDERRERRREPSAPGSSPRTRCWSRNGRRPGRGAARRGRRTSPRTSRPTSFSCPSVSTSGRLPSGARQPPSVHSTGSSSGRPYAVRRSSTLPAPSSVSEQIRARSCLLMSMGLRLVPCVGVGGEEERGRARAGHQDMAAALPKQPPVDGGQVEQALDVAGPPPRPGAGRGCRCRTRRPTGPTPVCRRRDGRAGPPPPVRRTREGPGPGGRGRRPVPRTRRPTARRRPVPRPPPGPGPPPGPPGADPPWRAVRSPGRRGWRG